MRYLARRETEDGEEFRDLSEDEFAEYRRISAGFRSIQHVEETYDVMIGNYLEFEETIARLSVRQLAKRHSILKLDYFDPARRTCHRALANLLSSARAFDEQTRAAVARIFGPSSEEIAWLKAAFSHEYDSSMGYRVMYQLRNHAQHEGLAVTGVAFGARSLTSTRGDQRVVAYVEPSIHLDALREGGRVKRDVIAQLEALMPDHADPNEYSVPVLPYVREYVAGLSNVIMAIRKRTETLESGWLGKVTKDYLALGGEPDAFEPFGFQAVLIHDGRIREELWIGNRIAGRLDQLREENGPLKALTRTFLQQ